LRGFNERAGNMFERSVDGKKNERRVDVSEHENYSEGAVEKSGDGAVSDVEYWRKPLRTPSLPRMVFQA